MGKVRKTMTIENVAQKTQLLLKQVTFEYEEKFFFIIRTTSKVFSNVWKNCSRTFVS